MVGGLLCVLATAALHYAGPGECGEVLVIDDFEAGVTGWTLNDGSVPRMGRPTIPSIFAISPGAPETGSRQAALIEFAEGKGTWASVSKSVNGQAWQNRGSTGISLWLRGDGRRQSVMLVLRSYIKTGESVRDTSFSKKIELTTSYWTRTYVPFASFKDREGRPPDGEHLRAVKLFQFVETGSWDAVRFTVDDIRVEQVATPHTVPAEALLLDFDTLEDVSKLRHGVCLGSEAVAILNDSTLAGKIKGLFAMLGRPMVRVRLSDFCLPGHIGVRTTELHRTIAWIRSAGADPLLCMDVPLGTKGLSPDAGWREFGAFCTSLAARRRTEPGTRYYEIGSEPILSGQFRTIEAVTETYNALAAQVLLADPAAIVGGMGFASSWDEHLAYFVRNARTLHFLSFHFYGAHTPLAGDEELFEAACRAKTTDLPHQLTPAEVRKLLDGRPGTRPELWITECALSSAREASGQARDARLRNHFGAAWDTAFSLSACAQVDRILWFKAFGNGWGLLNDDGSSTPALRALTLLSEFLPAGAHIGTPTNFGKLLFALAGQTSDARCVVIAHGAEEVTANLHLNGTPAVRPLRMRRIDPGPPSGGFVPLVPTPFQKLTLRGPGMAVVEANGPG